MRKPIMNGGIILTYILTIIQMEGTRCLVARNVGRMIFVMVAETRAWVGVVVEADDTTHKNHYPYERRQ